MATALCMAWRCATAMNPILPNVGMADPHVHVFNGTFYLYTTHDWSPNNTGFRMDDWVVYSSVDLLTWVAGSVLLPQDTPAPPAAWHECWATDAAASNGAFYFYLSIGTDQVAVMKGATPIGPWIDVLGRLMLNASLGASLRPPTTIRDPCVFGDEDGAFYIIFGVYEYYIARLAPDMVSLAEPPRHISVLNPTGPYGNKTDDKPFLHKQGGVYYLSWGCFYGMSASPYGPYAYSGSVVSTDAIEPAFRMNDTAGPWYSHQVRVRCCLWI